MNWLDIDKAHVWHPYNALPSKTKILPVKSTNKTSIFLEDGKELIDGMSSWWSAIHGYNHPKLNEALKKQVDIMPHIMFGGLAHEQSSILSKKLIDLTGLNSVFLCDSGSVSVEVALKTAILYQKAKGLKKYKFLALENAYHGDTLGAMSVCDPNNSMHSIYGTYLSEHIFTKAPELGFQSDCSDSIIELEKILKKHNEEIAAFILEPIVQGAGGMRIYNPNYLKKARELCSKYDILLIADEIATGFGHTGRMFACEWAEIKPDIMKLNRNYITPFISLVFLVVGLSGLLMFFHLFDGYTEVVHEYLGVFFVICAIFHIILNWKALKIHFKRGVFIFGKFIVIIFQCILLQNNPLFFINFMNEN